MSPWAPVMGTACPEKGRGAGCQSELTHWQLRDNNSEQQPKEIIISNVSVHSESELRRPFTWRPASERFRVRIKSYGHRTETWLRETCGPQRGGEFETGFARLAQVSLDPRRPRSRWTSWLQPLTPTFGAEEQQRSQGGRIRADIPGADWWLTYLDT